MVVSNIFNFHPYLVIWSYFIHIFQVLLKPFSIFSNASKQATRLRTNVEAAPEKKMKMSESSASAPSAATTASSDVSCPIFVWCGCCGELEQDLSIYIYIMFLCTTSSEIWSSIYTYLRSTWLSYRCILMVVCNVFESKQWGMMRSNRSQLNFLSDSRHWRRLSYCMCYEYPSCTIMMQVTYFKC